MLLFCLALFHTINYRLFILMVYLGQKSLCSSSAGQVLESILGLLSKTLLPLHSSSGESQIGLYMFNMLN